ncbi:hypothetical protein GCM10010912_32030 [Paenibacillus albidus]|uniref:DUF3934 domain-containing protein n=1 Tax=Paenibacillus albidus TaxID=2041023 RepID=A0A917FHY1_9BACL|nr:DUF3934 family protein [Paenibacillus albidus]GGF84434.1 hypothetical protein GCM10010912_32030 [Paenibacillus albidus]
MGAKSKGGGTGRGTGSKGWTRWNKTAKPKAVKGSTPTGQGPKGTGVAKGTGVVKKTGGNKGASSK